MVVQIDATVPERRGMSQSSSLKTEVEVDRTGGINTDRNVTSNKCRVTGVAINAIGCSGNMSMAIEIGSRGTGQRKLVNRERKSIVHPTRFGTPTPRGNRVIATTRPAGSDWSKGRSPR